MKNNRVKRTFAYRTLCLLALLSPSELLQAEVSMNASKSSIEVRSEELLAKLTLEEKVSLLSGADWWSTVAIERVGIPSIKVADGPNGVRSNNSEPTTLFPTGVAMASTWNPELIEDVGAAMGRETLAMGSHVLLGPNINIQRTPLAGRNFESYSEDPHLAGAIGVGFVRGVQSENVGTSVKHFVANNQEHQRQTGSSNVDERTLREIYLPAFEQVIKQAKPWTVMAAYNKVNGQFMTENKRLIQGVLKNEWGFDGVVVSDWGALHATETAASAGLDLEMPGPASQYGSKLIDAVKRGDLNEDELNDNVRRMLRLILKAQSDGDGSGVISRGAVNTLEHQRLSQTVAEEAITLLKNRGNLLPIDTDNISSIAVIGPNADAAIMQGGGSSQVVPFQQITPLEALRAQLGSDVEVHYAQGVDNEPEPATLDARLLSPTVDKKEQGLRVEYFENQNFQGEPAKTAVDRYFSKLGFADELSESARNNFSARWSGFFWPKVSGSYDFELVHLSSARLTIDGKTLITDKTQKSHTSFLEFLQVGARTASIELTAGKGYPITLDYIAGKVPLPMNLLRLASRSPSGKIAEAVALAAKADIAIVVAGVSTTSESEGRDRTDLELYGEQNALIEAVLKANKNTVVVLNNGAPLAMPWIDRADTVVESWLPGQEGGRAIANVLLGKANPSGKLPVSFPKRLQDNPSYLFYPGHQDAMYGEGIFVGYRYYDKKEIEPLFPFGHGLSFTTFEYGELEFSRAGVNGAEIQIALELKNTGTRAGKEVVQLYVRDEISSEVRPLKELKGFKKVALNPGETKKISFSLSKRDLSYYDVHSRSWVAEPGVFKIMMGSSSRDIRQELAFVLGDDMVSTLSDRDIKKKAVKKNLVEKKIVRN